MLEPARAPLLRASAIVAAAVPVHVALALATELSPDEAYYLVAARTVPIVDHPPLLPWVIGLSDRLTALPLELRVRLPAIVFSCLLAMGLAALAEEQSERAESAGPIAALLATWLLLPATAGFVATPDAPALLGVIAAIAYAQTPSRSPATFPAVTSLIVAAAALAKVVVVPIALLAAVVSPYSWRARLLWLSPLALSFPLLVPSLRFQLTHAYRTPVTWHFGDAASALGAFLAASVLLWSPAVLVPGLRRVRSLPPVYGGIFLMGSILVAASALLRARPPEPNWWSPAAVPLVVAGSIALANAPRRRLHLALAVAFAPTLIAIAHVVHPWLPLPRQTDPTARLHGWKTEDPPCDAAGVGPYGCAAERCIYRASCDEINLYFNRMQSVSKDLDHFHQTAEHATSRSSASFH